MESQEEEQTLKMIFEGIRGIMGRKIPFTLHRTEEAFLSGPRYLGCFLLMCEAVLQLDDSFICNLYLSRPSVPLLEGEGAEQDRNVTPTFN